MLLNIHSILSLGTVDGGGNRTVVFLQGCNLNCLYCHNPDSRPLSNLNLVETDEVLSRVMKFKPYWGRRGGVTLSGGEPFLQAESALELVLKLKEHGIHTAIDTSGSVKNEFCDKLIEKADLIILDLKHTDFEEYFKLTGGRLQTVLDNLATIKRVGTRFIIRQVIVEGLNDTLEQILRLKELSCGADRIELLPYHTMGVAKWQEMGIPYPLLGVPPTSMEKIAELEKILKNN